MLLWSWDTRECAPNDKLHCNSIGDSQKLLEWFYSYLRSRPDGVEVIAIIDERFRILANMSSPDLEHRFYNGMFVVALLYLFVIARHPGVKTHER